MQSALFNFQSLLIVVLLFICTCAFVRQLRPSLIDPKAEGFAGIFRRAAVIGDRLSPVVAFACISMAFATLFYR